jgi:Family of unknown function (DUF6481)
MNTHAMAFFKAPTFQERTALALAAKQKALDKLRAKPAVDPAILAERKAAAEVRDAAAVEARRVRAVQREEAKAEQIKRAAETAAAAAAKPALDEAEQKALRDARYAARKKRKS